MRVAMALVLGGWLLGTLMVAGVATQNFFIIDRILRSSANPALQHPTFRQKLSGLAPGEAREILRYLASELNRFYFYVWGWLELAFGGFLLAGAVWGLHDRRLVVGFAVMLCLVLVSNFYLIPHLVEVGRSLDFVPRDPAPPELALFGRLHAAYSGLDLARLAVGVWMAVVLMRLGPGPD